MPRLHAG